MRYLGLDIGDRRIGVAVSDEMGIIATGIETITYDHPKTAIERIERLVEDIGVAGLVVGWPVESSGKVGRQARKVDTFLARLDPKIDLPIIRWDERMTSVMAERVLLQANVRRNRRRQVVDKVAATLILQSWLDAQSSKKKHP